MTSSKKRRELDPQTKAFLEELEKQNMPPFESMTVKEVRAFTESLAWESKAKIAKIETKLVPGPAGKIALRIYTPEGKGPFPAVVYLHGGGWIFGSLDLIDPICREICAQAQCLVFSVEYRLAPEHKFPQPLEDCFAAATWVIDHIQEFHGIKDKIVIAGDSAGGNLAAGVALMMKQKKRAVFCGQLLMVPVTEYRFDTRSYDLMKEGYQLTKAKMQWFWSLYLEKSEDGQNPLASPLKFKDLSELPPAIVVIAEYDPLHDEGLHYAERLREAGVPVTILSYPTIHTFIVMANALDIGKQAIKDVSMQLKKLFGQRTR